MDSLPAPMTEIFGCGVPGFALSSFALADSFRVVGFRLAGEDWGRGFANELGRVCEDGC